MQLNGNPALKKIRCLLTSPLYINKKSFTSLLLSFQRRYTSCLQLAFPSQKLWAALNFSLEQTSPSLPPSLSPFYLTHRLFHRLSVSLTVSLSPFHFHRLSLTVSYSLSLIVTKHERLTQLLGLAVSQSLLNLSVLNPLQTLLLYTWQTPIPCDTQMIRPFIQSRKLTQDEEREDLPASSPASLHKRVIHSRWRAVLQLYTSCPDPACFDVALLH